MGSSGIRRRKPKRRLRPVRDDALGWPTSDEAPPIMWSEPGSGFEASPYSPAGNAQRQWWFLRRASRLTDEELDARARSAFNAALPVMVAFTVVVGAVGALSAIFSPGPALAIVALAVVVWFTKRR